MSEITDILGIQFPNLRFEFRAKTELGATPVFKAVLPDVDSLRDTWEQIASVIGAAFQSGMGAHQDFEKWNIYIFYVCEGQVPAGLKGEIESDKFVARKIVVAGTESATALDDLIDQYITGADLVSEFAEPAAAAAFGADERSQNRKVALVDLEKLIGGRFVEDRNRKEQRTRLSSLLDMIESRFADEINKG